VYNHYSLSKSSLLRKSGGDEKSLILGYEPRINTPNQDTSVQSGVYPLGLAKSGMWSIASPWELAGGMMEVFVRASTGRAEALKNFPNFPGIEIQE